MALKLSVANCLNKSFHHFRNGPILCVTNISYIPKHFSPLTHVDNWRSKLGSKEATSCVESKIHSWNIKFLERKFFKILTMEQKCKKKKKCE